MSQSTNSIELAIVKLAPTYGMDPSKLSGSEYAFLSLMARSTFAQKAEAVGKAVGSVLRTKVFHLQVLPSIVQENENFCKACPGGYYKELQDGTPVCTDCGCSGIGLTSKQRDPKGECTKRYWSNKGKATERVASEITIPTTVVHEVKDASGHEVPT